jgi:hypothetical protein
VQTGNDFVLLRGCALDEQHLHTKLSDGTASRHHPLRLGCQFYRCLLYHPTVIHGQ